MEQLTVYRAQGKEIGLTFLFKYDLKGNLKSFELQEGTLNAAQMKWLFAGANFPADESIMKFVWMAEKGYKDKFEITVKPADLSFEAFYEAYKNKVKPVLARKAWDKLSEADRIKAFDAIPRYLNHIKKTGEGHAHPVTWINQQRWLDEYPETFTPPPKERIGKVFNSAIQDLANKKTEK